MIRLLSTDFDGTLVDHFAHPPVAPALFELFAELKRCGVLWALNTGRDLALALDGLREFKFPLEPDYILTNEREIFHRNASGQWQDYGDWNQRCLAAHEWLLKVEQQTVEEILRFLLAETKGQPIFEKEQPVGIWTQDDEEMDRVVAHLHAIRSPDSLLHYQRNTIYLRFCHADYSKGAALGELCRLTGISAEETYTVGDHHNDISMLDGAFARWPAAPGNAIEEVKAAVRAAGGYIAETTHSRGVIESLHHFLHHQQLAPAGFSR